MLTKFNFNSYFEQVELTKRLEKLQAKIEANDVSDYIYSQLTYSIPYLSILIYNRKSGPLNLTIWQPKTRDNKKRSFY